MKKIRDIMYKYASGKRVLILFILTNLLYAGMLMITIPKTMAFSGGMKLLDMMPLGYDSGYIQALFKALGANGRAVYLHYQIPMDMIYPFLFGISYSLLMAYFLKKLKKFNVPHVYLCFLPVIAGIADYLENIGIITMLITFPHLSPTSMAATNAFTMAKSVTTTVYFVALIIILCILGIQRMSSRKTAYNKV